ncbi:MAG TPA: aspartyl/asparaginyl beta-hydroxylase domain-containing protein [Thermoanaerobaculia bacterium]|jgi:hypothetical protein|nr:aspartyl/asparaginyl beta-hydroxylase domain-containing protein [Thermoanaerobaculia bacterium]
MQDADFDWNRPYVIPASLCFRPIPSGGLQVDLGGGEATVEVPRDWVALLLAFARSQTAEAAYEAATREWEVERESFQELLQACIAKGLLQASDTNPDAPSRLALFAQAQAGAPLRSHFPLQRPVELYPGLDTREIHDRERFPWVAALEGSFPVIQDEFARLMAAGSGFATVYRAQTSTGEWAASYLWAYGKKVEETCRLCPETARILSSIPGVAEFGTTLYSALAPHTHISPHFGYTNAKLRCQLPLRVPGHCKLKVGGHEIEQREGRCIVFDDSFLHSAWNDSDEPRFVLVFDFFHPDLTPDEVQYLLRLASQRELAKPLLDQVAASERVDWAAAR